MINAEKLDWLIKHGQSFTMNWGEDTGQWEVSWIDGQGKRHTYVGRDWTTGIDHLYFLGYKQDDIKAGETVCEHDKRPFECQICHPVPPVDRSQRCTLSGNPETPEMRELRPDGQQKDYVILCDEERLKGFVRPVRNAYVHVGINPKMQGHVIIKAGLRGCGRRTQMGSALAETYARDPKFYSGTFCVTCGEHRPLEEFMWEGTTELVGS